MLQVNHSQKKLPGTVLTAQKMRFSIKDFLGNCEFGDIY